MIMQIILWNRYSHISITINMKYLNKQTGMISSELWNE